MLNNERRERKATRAIGEASPRLRALLGFLLLVVVAFAGCGQTPAPAPEVKALTVAAASDLQFAFTEIGSLFERRMGTKITFMFGSSGNLAQQIEAGAPVDLFASADEEYVRQLADKGAVVQGTQQIYALGRLALVYFKASGLSLGGLADLARPEVKRISLANPNHAPYGRAAKEALIRAGQWEQVMPKVVYGENVRQALQFVQTGNAEAGIVALSIADVPEVGSVVIDESLYQPLRQTMAVVKGTRQEMLAREFEAFVVGPSGRSIMPRYGYNLPGEK